MTKDTKERSIFLVVATVIIGIVFWGARLWNGSTQNAEGNLSEQVTLAVATDLHYLAPELTDQGVFFQEFIKNGDGKVVQYSEEVTEAFVGQIIDEKPSAVILSGDLTFNGEKQSHIRLAEKLQRIENAGIPVLVMPGNHDMYSSNAASFHEDSYTFVESVSAEKFAEIYQEFGFSEAISRDEKSLSYIVEITPSFRVLMLDINTMDSPGTIKSATFAWAEEQLKQAKEDGARVVTVSHQNVLQYNSLFSYGYVMGKNDFVQELYEEYDVICNLSGHIHMQHIAESENGLPEIVTSSMIVSPNQYGVLKLKGTVADYHTVQVDVAAWAKENGKDNLQGFSDYSHTFMWDTAYRQAANSLDGSENVNSLSTFYADVNTAYFAGRMDELKWNEELLSGWKKQGGFIATYLQSIADDGFKNHTEFSFDYKITP